MLIGGAVGVLGGGATAGPAAGQGVEASATEGPPPCHVVRSPVDLRAGVCCVSEDGSAKASPVELGGHRPPIEVSARAVPSARTPMPSALRSTRQGRRACILPRL